MNALTDIARFVWQRYDALTVALGRRRRTWRHLAGLCLVLLGVHATSELLVAAAYAVAGTLDTWSEWLVEYSAGLLAGQGVLAPETAANHGELFAAWFGPDDKERAALYLALAAEVWIAVRLLPFAWGVHHRLASTPDHAVRPAHSWSFWPFDLERVTAVAVTALFGLQGVFVAGRSVENACADLVGLWLPGTRVAINAAALAALITLVLLVWRMVPGLIMGAARQSEHRFRRAQRLEITAAGEAVGPTTRWWIMRARLARFSRGADLALFLLPLAVVGLALNVSLSALWSRLGVSP